MTTPMPTQGPAFANKLVKVLGLLGSDYAGERAAAGLKAHEMVERAGLTWPEVIACSDRDVATWREPHTPREAAALCLKFPEVLNDWEADFCRSILARTQFSAKQVAKIMRVVEKVREYAEAQA